MIKNTGRKDPCLFASILGFLILLTLLLPSPTAAAQSVQVDEERVAAAGILKLAGRHVTLYTDDRDRKDLAELVIVFDLAVNQWCDHFQINQRTAAHWKVSAFLMADQPRFVKAGLVPGDLPEFLAGYAIGDDIWLYPQRGNYYTRHLLLHEGTHLFMNKFLGDFGPPWYSEGMAEWLGLHRWDAEAGTLKLGYRVKDRREADYWGRVKIVRDQLAVGEGMSLDDVFSIEPNSFKNVEFYGWSWAACEFLSHHPLTKENFDRLKRRVDEPAHIFRRKVLTKLSREDKLNLDRDWNLFVHEIDYGYDIVRGTLIDAERIEEPLASAPDAKRFRIDGQHSWQATGIRLNKGDRISITGSGQYQVKMTDQPWPAESGGISLRYYQSQPLGMLMATVLPPADRDSDINQPLISPLGVGYDNTISAETNGELCLRINECPAQLGDNLGGLEVTVEKLK